MKRLIKIIIWFSAVSFIAAQDCKTNLIIDAGSGSAEIYLNEALIGTGSVSKEVLQGSYIIQVKEGGLLWNPASVSDSIFIEGCPAEKRLSYNLKEKRLLTTEPQDAYVYFNNILLGHSPIFLTRELTPLTLTKPGYQARTINSFNQGEAVKLDFIGKKEEVSFYQTGAFRWLLAGIAVFGGTTAYFKLKADRKFDEYQETGNDEFLRQTRQLDLISGITMGALQINFGLLIYYILTD